MTKPASCYRKMQDPHKLSVDSDANSEAIAIRLEAVGGQAFRDLSPSDKELLLLISLRAKVLIE